MIVPELVTLEGDQMDNVDEIVEIMGIDYSDAVLVSGGMLSGNDIKYLNDKYPEYMGIWSLVTAAVKGAVSVGKKISAAVKKKKKSNIEKQRKAAEQKKAAAAALEAERQRQAQLKAFATAQQKNIMMIAAAALALVILLGRKR